MAAERERYEGYAGNPIDPSLYLGRFRRLEPSGATSYSVDRNQRRLLIKVRPALRDCGFRGTHIVLTLHRRAKPFTRAFLGMCS